MLGIHIAFKQIMNEAMDLNEIDPITGFNAIHNVVSGDCIGPNFPKLNIVIEQLMEKGCDINHRSVSGTRRLSLCVRVCVCQYMYIAFNILE